MFFPFLGMMKDRNVCYHHERKEVKERKEEDESKKSAGKSGTGPVSN